MNAENQGDGPDNRKSLSGTELIEWLLDYEISAAERYRRFITILMVAPTDTDANFFLMLRDIFRQSDEFITDNGSAITIIMRETDPEGGLVAVQRSNKYCGEIIDLRFSLASYPADGRSAEEILNKAHRRLDSAIRGPHGSIVNHD